jgi:RNA polymerase sigma-70 factor (ECF subfamily)
VILSMVLKRRDLRLLEGGSREVAPRSDEALIEAVQRGDQRVASELYERLIEVVDHTLYRIFGRREPDHDDLVQSTFEQIVRTLTERSYARACNLRTWASSIASHVGLNALRARRRERNVIDRLYQGDMELVPLDRDAEKSAQARAELEELRATLGAMKPEQAHAVFLHDVLGHDLAEMALLLDISVAAAQSRLVRGRRELYRCIERSENLRGRRAP